MKSLFERRALYYHTSQLWQLRQHEQLCNFFTLRCELRAQLFAQLLRPSTSKGYGELRSCAWLRNCDI